MFRSRQSRLVTLAILGALAVWPAVAAAHGKGVLKLANRRLVAGDTLRLTGEKFPKASTLTLLLAGAGGRTRLAEVRTDTNGAFRSTALVPADLPVGSYRLVALASDGDEVGALDVEVVPAAAHEHEMMEHADDASEPSAQPLALDRARSPWVTGAAVGVIAAALVVGGVLLRRPGAA